MMERVIRVVIIVIIELLGALIEVLDRKLNSRKHSGGTWG